MKEMNQLESMTQGVQPISVNERMDRIAKARQLMEAKEIDALLLEAGTTLEYFTGVRWSQSDRVAAAVIPARGEIAYVCPTFEEARLREMMTIGDAVRTWEEHESPFQQIAQALADLGIRSGRIGVERATRYAVVDELGKAAPRLEFSSAAPVVDPCRGIKSPAEIALMQRAMDVTIEAYKVCVEALREGMSQDEFRDLSAAAHRALGVRGHIDVQFGETTAFPHGSRETTYLKEGDVVLMDGGCSVEGYWSDISRTTVFGVPTSRQREVWELEKAAQAAAFSAAKLGVAMESVDAAARGVIVGAGFGPGYRVPGLPHRTGHGIGLDMHEPYNVVQGNTIPLAPGMCFSDEPMIVIYGEFGVRLEDCIYMSDKGPRFFTIPSPSIDQPFA